MDEQKSTIFQQYGFNVEYITIEATKERWEEVFKTIDEILKQ